MVPFSIGGNMAGLTEWLRKNRETVKTEQNDPDIHGTIEQLECPHGDGPNCVRCFMQEVDAFPETQYMPMDDSDLKKAVLKLPANIQNILRKHANSFYLAGGYIRSIITNEPIRDYDIFCSDSKDRLVLCVDAEHLVEKKVITDNAITINGDIPTQYIFRWTFDSAQGLLNSFDFSIAKAAIWYDGKDWKGIVDQRYYQDLAAKRLVYNSGVKGRQGAAHIARLLKFVARGYHIESNDLANILTWTISELNTVAKVDKPALKKELLSSLEELRQVSSASWEHVSKPIETKKAEEHSYYSSS